MDLTLEAVRRGRDRASRFFRALCALLAVVSGLWCLLQPCSAADAPEILAIRQLYAEAQAQLKANTAAKADYYQTNRSDPTSGIWFAGTPPASDESVSATASIYQIGDRVSFVVVDDSDGAAGDWTQHAEYYFRGDGSLAFIFCRISTFYSEVGALLVEKRLYFDQTGMRIRETKSLTNLSSGERLKDVKHSEPELPIYRSVKALTAVFPR